MHNPELAELFEAKVAVNEQLEEVTRLAKWLERKDTKEFLVKGFMEKVLEDAVKALPFVTEEVKGKVHERIGAVAIVKDFYNVNKERVLLESQLEQINMAIDNAEVEAATELLDEPMGR